MIPVTIFIDGNHYKTTMLYTVPRVGEWMSFDGTPMKVIGVLHNVYTQEKPEIVVSLEK